MDLVEAILLLTFAVVILYIIYKSAKRFAGEAQRYTKTIHGEVLETDLRLPFKRFKQLYPWSQISYPEYKRLQMERAFRKAVSSKTNKRMVR